MPTTTTLAAPVQFTTSQATSAPITPKVGALVMVVATETGSAAATGNGTIDSTLAGMGASSWTSARVSPSTAAKEGGSVSWCLVPPGAGTGTITINLSAAPNEGRWAIFQFDLVDPAGPVKGVVQNDGLDTTGTVSLALTQAPTAADTVVMLTGSRNGWHTAPFVPGNGLSTLASSYGSTNPESSLFVATATGKTDAAVSVSHMYTASNMGIALIVKAAPSGGPETHKSGGTVTVSAVSTGGGRKTSKRGAIVTSVAVSAGGGHKTSKRGAVVASVATSSGGGHKLSRKGSVALADAVATGGGRKSSRRGSVATASSTSLGGGRKTARSGSDAIATATALGGGEKGSRGGAAALASLTAIGGGWKTGHGGGVGSAEALAVGGGAVFYPGSGTGGATVYVTATAIGGGRKLARGGAVLTGLVSATGAGIKEVAAGAVARADALAYGGGSKSGGVVPPPIFTSEPYVLLKGNLATGVLARNDPQAILAGNTAGAVLSSRQYSVLLKSNLASAALSKNSADATIKVVETTATWRYNMSQWKTGDTYPPAEVSLKNGDGTPVDLTTANAVAFHSRPAAGTTPLINAPMQIVDAATGQVNYLWKSGDLSTVGDFSAEVEVTWADGTIQTFPAAGYFTYKVAAQLDPPA